MHGLGIIHRDIKTSNAVVSNPNDLSLESDIKIIDLGLAITASNQMLMEPFSGTQGWKVIPI